ncbi:MAG: radical SAM/SPASM domain-containing protein [Longicatena sp.]
MQFKRIYIEITNTCNLACSFCIQNQRTRKAMNLEEFKHVVKEISPFSKYVYLHILGEPLSHPLLKEFLEILKEAKIQVNITTNGTLLKEKAAVLLAGNVRQINVSLHSFPAHQQATYLMDCVSVGNCLAKQKVHVNYRLWSLQEEQIPPQTREIIDFLASQYDVAIQESDIKRCVRFDLDEYVHLHFEKVFEWPKLSSAFIGDKGRCLGMKQMCGILSDGRVVPCCMDSAGDASLGNIFEEPFEYIINTQRAKNIVNNFANQNVVEPICQHCSYRLRFSK